MFTIEGKFNSAKIMIDSVDQETMSQIYSFLNHPAFADGQIVIMPDTHAGAGAVIGFTMPLNDYIIPNIVGVDIGCGIESYCLGEVDIDFSELDKFVRGNIPSGFAIRDKASNQLFPKIKEKLDLLAKKVGMDAARAFTSIGTLGGGNHFIEIEIDSTNRKWLTIHTGSRNFGLQIATYHQNKAKAYMKDNSYKGLEYLHIDEGGAEYLEDMKFAQLYAENNRQVIASKLLNYFSVNNPEETIKSVHNYINFEDNIIRKGAISAYAGQKLVIPLNMRDGVIVGVGKGNPGWNYSAPHGAGRVLSRSQAKKSVDLRDYQKSMKGIWSSCVNLSTIDESPMVYKPMDAILETIGDTIEIIDILKPIYNFKA